MALIFVDGSGYTDFARSSKKYTGSFFGAGADSLTGSIDPGPFPGTGALHFASSDPLWQQYPPLGSRADWIVGFWVKPASIVGTKTFWVLQDSTASNLCTQFVIQVTSGGKILCGAGFGDNVGVFPAHFDALSTPSVTSVATLPLGSFSYVCVKIHFAAFPNQGGFSLYINGSLDSQVTQSGFAPDSRAVADRPILMWNATDGSEITTSQYVICDASGSVNNLPLSPRVQIQTVFPSSDVSNGGWTASSGSDNFAMVNENPGPDGDGSYISLPSLSSPDQLFGVSPGAAGGSILGVALNVAWSKGSSSGQTLQPAVKVGGTLYPVGSPVTAPASGYATAQAISETNPATGAAWTMTDIAPAAWGFRGSTGTGERVSQFFLEIVTRSGGGATTSRRLR